MKKKLNDMSPDMFNDAMSSTPIPVFTTATDADKNAPSVPEVSEVSFDANQIKNELIKIDFDKQTVSARALYEFLVPTERFNFWCKRMFSYGLIENVDFTTVKFLTVVNNSGTKEIGDYLLTIDAAKHIAMVQRSEKGFQARNYFINIEKLYWKSINSKNQNPVTSVTPFEKIRNLLVEIEGEMIPQKDYDSLIEKTEGLEKQLQQLTKKNELHNKQMELSVELFSKKVDRALKDFVTEVEIVEVEEMEAPALRISNPSKVHFNIEKFPQVYRMWYLELSEIFTTTDAERIGEKYHISRTTIFRMLRNKHYNLFLFRKLRCGQYEKCYTKFE
jgi:phage anti-repressor protein